MIEDALEVVGLQELSRSGISNLSGGQQQRALIARALAGEPDLFLLDEPTAGVDLPHQEALADALRTLAGRGATIILVAHELGPMRPLVDRAVVMRNGRIVYDGAPLDDHEVHSPTSARRTPTTTSTPSRTTCPCWPRPWTSRRATDERPRLTVLAAVHAARPARGDRHRPRRPCGRHLPGAAPDVPDGRRPRARRGHGGRNRPGHRLRPDLDGGGRRRAGRGGDRGDPRARQRRRRPRPGPALLRRPRRRHLRGRGRR